MKKLILALLLLVFSACSHGPQVTVYSSFPSTGVFNGATSSGAVPSVPYVQTVGWFVYAPQGEQSLLDYCEGRNTDGTEPPQFAQCSTDLTAQGFQCTTEVCEVNGFSDGLNCNPGSKFFVEFADSENYLGFTPADNQTLLDYCNISIQTK